MNLLDIEQLSVRFSGQADSSPAVDRVSFSLRRGQAFCLVGESGSGKSLTALSLMRLLPGGAQLSENVRLQFTDPETGVQTDLTQLDADVFRQWRGRRIAMVFQEPMTSLNPVMTIGDQLAEAVLHSAADLSDTAVQVRVLDLLHAVQLTDGERFVAAYPHRLSGGQRQRVMIAMALAGDPDILIADEPTTALDVTIQADVLRLLHRLQHTRNMALLFITHDLGIVAQLGDQVGVMHRGRIVEQGEVATVIGQPQHPYTQALLACLPQRLPREPRVAASEMHYERVPVLRIQDVCVDFPRQGGFWRRRTSAFRAVDKVSAAIAPGEILALVGESGCGKTTLGRTVLRLVRPSAGFIQFQGHALDTLSGRAWRGQCQIVFQDSAAALNPRLTLATALTEPMKVIGKGESHADRLELAAALLREVQLEPDMLWRLPHQLSGGQRQRANVARALVQDPVLMVCDEMTSALDVSVQARVLELLLRLREERGLAMLFITHDIGVVEYISDRTAVMHQGRIVECGDTLQVCQQPVNPYTRKLISAVPRIAL